MTMTDVVADSSTPVLSDTSYITTLYYNECFMSHGKVAALIRWGGHWGYSCASPLWCYFRNNTFIH